MPWPTATKTTRTATGEFGPTLPVYTGSRPGAHDDRVILDDGRVCYVVDDTVGVFPHPILCTELVATDAGDNEVRRFRAADRSSNGITARTLTRGHLTCSYATGTEVGYYDAR